MTPEQQIREAAERLMVSLGWLNSAHIAITPSVMSANAIVNGGVRRSAQHKPQPKPKKPLPPHEFLYKKRRERQTFKSLPFSMKVTHLSREKEDEVTAYLRDTLGEQGREWVRTGFGEYIFAKREYTVSLIMRFRGTPDEI